MHNQNGAVLTHNAGVPVMVSKNCFYDEEISAYYQFYLQPSVPKLSSNKHARYLTLECCSICISPYFMLSLYIYINISQKLSELMATNNIFSKYSQEKRTICDN